jgi:dienelactone hydrolase
MSEHFLESSFEKTQTSIFYYPALEESRDAVFILKGLYGKHIPSGDSWDNELVALLQSDHHVICIRTGRLDAEEKKEQFEGKTFAQECEDVANAFAYARRNLLAENVRMNAIALSFGGTTLLGLPAVFQSMDTVVLIGSGCGRSLGTTKPLLSTLTDTDTLLRTTEQFKRTLVFLHGGRDTVVPRESQQKIFSSAESTAVRAWVEYPSLGHELDDVSESKLATLANCHLRNFKLKVI